MNQLIESKFARRIHVIAWLVLSAILLSACVSPMTIQARGPVVEQRYQLNGIDRVYFYGSGEVRILPSKESVLVVSAARNVQEVLDIDISDDQVKAGPQRRVRLPSDSSPVYTLYVNELDHLSVSGYMSVKADQLSGEQLSLSVSGRATVDMRVTATALNIRSSGSAEITATGLVDQLKVRTSGSLKLAGSDLLARQVEIASSGSARVTIWAEESLDIRSSGSTRVRYRGQPVVSQSISGASSVEALNDD